MPYLLNVMASMGMIVDTFETACTWDRFEQLHANVISEVRRTMKAVCGAGFISCRFTHVYPDGPAPYFTFVAPGRYGVEAEQWLDDQEESRPRRWSRVAARSRTITRSAACTDPGYRRPAPGAVRRCASRGQRARSIRPAS